MFFHLPPSPISNHYRPNQGLQQFPTSSLPYLDAISDSDRSTQTIIYLSTQTKVQTSTVETMAIMKRWTIEERMTLHHLLARREYESKNDDWWNLYKELHDPIRGRTVTYEDWRHGGNSSRGKMWEAQIRKTKLEYTDEQRAAFTESRANLYAAARRLGIELPSKRAAHNAQTATPEQLLSARARHNTLPIRSSTRSPNAKPKSGIATASGSSRSNAQQLQGGNAKAANKNLQAAVVKASFKPSTLIATQKYKPQSQSAGVIKRKKTLVSNRPSSVHKVTP